MRAFSRLFAAIKPGQFLEAGTPTGLTGLNTHPSPRSTLIYLYSSTLDKLHQMPESSVYRQSAEALTKHRLSIIESIKPPGWDAWEQHIHYQVQENMDAFKISPTSRGTKINTIKPREVDPRTKSSEWDGELGGPVGEGIRSSKDRKPLTSKISGPHDYNVDRVFKEVKLAPEPQLTAEQCVSLMKLHVEFLLTGLESPTLRTGSAPDSLRKSSRSQKGRKSLLVRWSRRKCKLIAHPCRTAILTSEQVGGARGASSRGSMEVL
jgi:NADH dehydrogenase (ubiquinone) 1 alpha subcomplex subunit 5